MLEVKGSATQADLLADRLREALKEHDTRVSRPTKTRAVMLLDVEEWVEEGTLRDALRDALRRPEDAAPPELGALTVRTGPGGGGRYARAEVPARLAPRLAGLARVRVGWSTCRLRVLDDKGPRCFRCLEHGHVAAKCKGPDRAKGCFTCKQVGHQARDCPKAIPSKKARKGIEGGEKPTPAKEAQCAPPVEGGNPGAQPASG